MEEVKNNMGETKKVSEASEQQENTASNMPTYEQLKNWCDQLLMQRNQLAERLGQITEIHNKLPWLFKVIENKEVFDTDFVQSCVKEITLIMTPPEQPEQTDDSATKENNNKE